MSSTVVQALAKANTNATVNDSDSAINTDSGSESSKLSEADSTVIETNSRIFSNLDEIKLCRSLSDLHMCKHKPEQYQRNPKHLQTHAVYSNQRSFQRPWYVKKKYWRKSVAGIQTYLEEISKE